MSKSNVITLQGKDFTTYEGLLDQAHQEGLCRIATTIVQIPTQDNGNMAVVVAEVETGKGTFSGIGDANPGNVNRMILPHILRMAETRAKARALRDAVNVGETSVEELGAEDQEDGTGAARPAGASGNGSGPPASPKQREYLASLLERHGFPLPEQIDAIDKNTASAWIDELNQKGNAAKLLLPHTGEVVKTGSEPATSLDDEPYFQGDGDASFPKASPNKPASANQLATIAKLSRLIEAPEDPNEDMTSAAAADRITELSRLYNESHPATRRR